MEDLGFASHPDLNDPLLITAYHGWNDAGGAATHAAEYLVEQLGATYFASIDPDEYYDFTQARPHTRPTGEYSRELTWPMNDFYFASSPGGRDLIILVGTEPHLRWRRYTQQVMTLVDEYNVSEVVALGALLADTPHTRPVPLSGGASTRDLARRLRRMGIRGSRYEGPTGILSVVGAALADAGISNASIWAAVPHYISASPNPRASLALLRALRDLEGIQVPLTQLAVEAEQYEQQVQAALLDNPEAQQYVRDLEMQSLMSPEEPGLDLPPVDEASEPLEPDQAEGLIRSVEEFLRRRQNEQQPPDEEQ